MLCNREENGVESFQKNVMLALPQVPGLVPHKVIDSLTRPAMAVLDGISN